MIKFVLGFIFGIVFTAAAIAFGPKGLDSKIKTTGNVMTGMAEDATFAYCKKEFLLETQCYQKKKAEECDTLIKKKCG
jgi:hypothetical protein